MRNRQGDMKGTTSTRPYSKYNPDYAKRVGVKSGKRKRILIALVCANRNNWNAVIVIAEDGKPINMAELAQVRNYFFWEKDTVQIYAGGNPCEVGLWEYVGVMPAPTDPINTTLLTIKGMSEVSGSKLSLIQKSIGFAANNKEIGVMTDGLPNSNYFNIILSIMGIALGNLIYKGIKARVWKEVQAFDRFATTANATLKQLEEQEGSKDETTSKIYSSDPKFN